MKTLSKILWLFIYALPAVLFFSYHPVIGLGADASMNFELSLPLIWLVLFDILTFALMLILAWKHRQTNQKPHARPQAHQKSAKTAPTSPQADQQPVEKALATQRRTLKTDQRSENSKKPRFSWGHEFPGLSDRRFFLLALLPLYLTISVLWSDNRLRGLLTAGVMWLVFFAVFGMLFVLPQVSTPRKLRIHVLMVMFVSGVLVCKFCLAQSIMDILGLSRDATLLCPGCTYRSFGFPHPSGFAIEPQFMGNLLLAPALTALYLIVFRSRQFAYNLIREANHLETAAEDKILHHKVKLPEVNWPRWQRIGLTFVALDLSTMLFFTFSRGAIYAYLIALLIMLIFALRRRTFRWSLVAIPLVSFILSLGLQGTFAAVGPTAETFVSGITKSIHQLSLGIIDLRPNSTDQSVENFSADCGKLVENSTNTEENSAESVQNSTSSVQNSTENVDKTIDNCVKPEEKVPKTVEKLAGTVDKAVENHEEKSELASEQAAKTAIFEGYVPESTNIRLQLSRVAIWTWLSAPGRTGAFWIGLDCHNFPGTGNCTISTQLTPSSVLFGVGLGGAGTAMHAAHPDRVTSPKEIVQHQGFSLLLESGLVGVALAILGLLVAFFPNLFSRKFLDGRTANAMAPSLSPAKPTAATSGSSIAQPGAAVKVTSSESMLDFWHHPALPLLASLIVAYLITLNFFSGLPNALQIYLMPPLLYLIFLDPSPNYHQNRK